MRIIAGEHRGRKLLAPESDITRPVTDRVKQSLFDILAPLVPGSRVYDCFAGTGSMGLECLSRGASEITFFEEDRSALVRLKKNIEAIDRQNQCRVIAGDLFKWFGRPPAQENSADLIFLDPPYRFLRERPDDLRDLILKFSEGYLSKEGTVIFRHDAADSLDVNPLECFDQREYGGMTLEFLRRPSATK